MRIWQQSSLDISRLPGYAGFMGRHVGNVCSPDVEVETHGIETGTLTREEYFKYSGYGEHLKVVQIIENALRAEREGCDAVAISCFLDSGLEEARAALSIPVVSTFETVLEVAARTGNAVALVTRASHMNDRINELIRRYGHQRMVVDHVTLDFPMSLLELEAAYQGSREFVEQFRRQAQSLIRAGADVIVPAEGVLNTVLVENGVVEVDGVPVIDSYGTLMAYAEMMVRLRRRQGATRKGDKPPEQVAAQLRTATAALLVRPCGSPAS